MTGPTRPDGHLGVDTLADLGEGLLTPGEAADVEAHLAGCAACAAARAELLAVPAVLAAAAAADPMPADVVSRVDEALRASRDGVAAAPGREPVGSASATVTPIPVRDRTPVGMRLLQAAALLVVVFAGLGLAFTAFQGGGDESSTSAGGTADSAAERSVDGSFPVSASGRSWSPETVTAGVPDIVAGSLDAAAPVQEDSGGATPSAPRVLATEETARLAGGPPLAECVTALNDGPVTPLGVDLASWQGDPAVVIVLPTPGDASTVDAWVVGPECSQADATVLYFARVARP